MKKKFKYNQNIYLNQLNSVNKNIIIIEIVIYFDF